MSAFLNDMTYKEMVDLLKRMVQNLDSSFKTDVIEPIIQKISVPQVARRHPWREAIRPFNETMVVGQDSYILPYDFEKFMWLKNPDCEMDEMTPQEYYELIPDKSNRSSSIIGAYFVEKHNGVHTQPASAEKIVVTSNNSSDGGKKVLVRGEVNSTEFYEELTLSADSSPTATTTNNFTEIMYCSKGETFSGKVTITGNTSGTEFGYIAPEHRTSLFNRMILDSNPTKALVMKGEYLSTSFRPQHDYDVFRIPADLVFLQTLNYLAFERREADKTILADKKMDKELALAIRRQEKSYNIDSGMVLRNDNRHIIPEDHPLFD